MRKPKTRQAGVAMLLVLATIAMASVLGLSYLSVTSVKFAGSANLLRATRSRYLAESGLQHAMHLLRTGSPALSAATSANPMGPFHADGTSDSYVFYHEQISPGEYRVTARATCGELTRTSTAHVRVRSDYASRLQELDPEHCWRLGELGGTVAVDQEHHSDGTYENGVLLGQFGAIGGDLDTAVGFDGFNDHVNVGEAKEVEKKQLTFLIWFKAEDFAVPSARLISKAYGNLPQEHLWMVSTVKTGGKMRLRFRLTTKYGLTSTVVASDGDLEAGKWTFVAATYDGLRMKLYKDGEYVGLSYNFGDVEEKDPWGDKPDAWIGNNPPDDTSAPFHGLIDEVAIFKKALDMGQIESLYAARVASLDVLSWSE